MITKNYHVIFQESTGTQSITSVSAFSELDAAQTVIERDGVFVVDVIRAGSHEYKVKMSGGEIQKGQTSLSLFEFVDLCKMTGFDIVEWIDYD